MTNLDTSHDTLSADPLWLPHRYIRSADRMELVKISAERFAAAQFLADHKAEQPVHSAHLSRDDFAGAKVKSGNAHFIFHTAFCRSTLLVRALNIPGVSTGMSEPGVIANLDPAQDNANGLVRAVTDWLSRPQAGSCATFIKPTNHANALIPALMQAQPNSKAIVMSNSLASFLKSVNNRGLLGRQWARKLYLQVQAYAPLDLGMSGPEQFAMSDMQAAGLAWLLQRRWFLIVMEQLGAERFASLDSDAFDQNREATLRAALKLADIAIDDTAAHQAANAALFQSHAKLGGDFASREAEQSNRTASAIWDEEVGQVEQWIAAIAEQAGVPQLLPRPLL